MLHPGILQDIVENPGDDSLRLIMADWLEEQDDPLASPRGEFIRVQHELAKAPTVLPRECQIGLCEVACPVCTAYHKAKPGGEWRSKEQELLKRYRGRWILDDVIDMLPERERSELLPICARSATMVGGWPSDDSIFQFRRGFVGGAKLPMFDWMRFGPHLVGVAPLEEVVLACRRADPNEGRTVFSWRYSGMHRWPLKCLYARGGYPCCVPGDIFDLLPRSDFGSEKEANEALSKASLCWARAATPFLERGH
jgi:uncharacterized protein (TIGR02996 family)